MSNTKAVNHQREVPNIVEAMARVEQAIDGYGFDGMLRHLVKLRASQINRCSFCVKMHTREARDDGETNERLDRLIVWDHVGDFSEREKAALAWTEALTILDPKTDLGALRARLRESLSEQEIGVLTGIIAMINLWNRIGVAGH